MAAFAMSLSWRGAALAYGHSLRLPLPTEKRQEGQRDIAIRIQGVWIGPGEWLYADEDGMAVMAAP